LLQLFHIESVIEAGCDEAGRGCLAGPVVAAAVILPKDFENEQINDSKQLNSDQREEARSFILQHAVCYGIGVLDEKMIDKVNIHNASYLAMHKAIDQLVCKPEHIIVDGNRFIPYPSVPHTCIIKGDSKYLSIAAASILAKTYRDELMKDLHKKHPEYGWITNMGYPTEEHRRALIEFGPTAYHRKSFRLLPDTVQLSLFK
jgi:ribonuclease HII